jgi:FkbM family methyltransferase
VLDVGANIGYFSLVSLASSKNVVVHAFEPNPVNLLRTCESLALNSWALYSETSNSAGLHIHPVGVSDTNEILPSMTNKDNPGQSQFVSNLFEARALIKENRGSFQLSANRSVITLDAFGISHGWLHPDEGHPADSDKLPHIAILKVDVETLEHKVILGARRLLRSHLVRNVFMEVSARNADEVANARRAATVLIKTGYKLRAYGGFSGPGNTALWPQEDADSLVSNIVNEAKNTPVQQLHLWWTIS